MKTKTHICKAIKTSEAPQHIHATMFIEGEVYKVKECISAIQKAAEEKMRQWRMSCGAMAVMCDDVAEETYKAMYEEARAEEEFVKVEGKFRNSLGGSETKEQSILKTTCKEFLVKA